MNVPSLGRTRALLRPLSGSVDEVVSGARVLLGAGLVTPVRPDRLLRMGVAAARYGLTVPAGYGAAAARDPHALALVDDAGSMTFAELDATADLVAGALTHRGLIPGDAVGLLARNGRGFVLGMLTACKAGCDVVYLNTGFSGPQLAGVYSRERVRLVLADPELADAARHEAPELGVVELTDLPALAAEGRRAPLRPGRASRHVLMTSGTTGAPKGAARSAAGLEVPIAVLDRIPLRRRGTTVITSPMFHAWGFVHLCLAMLLQSTVVLSSRFDAEQTLRLAAEHRADALSAVPVIVKRLCEVDQQVVDTLDLSALRVIAVSGSALPTELGLTAMDRFGEVVYDFYGSTEIGYAAIATPADLRAAPGTVGRPPRGASVLLLDDDGDPVADGEVGTIWVGSSLTFEGYTSGDDKDRRADLVCSGDLGRFDDDGRLFVVGRADDMLITGGENVYPDEIEEVLLNHPDVADVAVVGVPDPEYGARLEAFVVPRTGRPVDPDALAEHVRSRLARFKVPRAVHEIDELPRNATGKVLRKELVARSQEQTN